MVNQTNNFFQEEAAMSKISVVYWSQTGNTEKLSEPELQKPVKKQT